MSKKFKSQASSARAASTTFGSTAFGSSNIRTSSLSYVTELPDLSNISDANVVVAVRNLGKKDSVTKTKALEDLSVLLAKSFVEDAEIEAWINLYPRTSIDNSRRVRQLAHSLQGSLTISTGKRIAPFLTKVIGSWLAGTYDNDKAVARAAEDALSGAFQTDEKRQSLWKIYRDVLMLYAEDAILIQTSKTLSDERNTSSDDAQAKFVRVAGSGIYLLKRLIQSNPINANRESGVSFHQNIVQLLNKKIWEYVYSQDPYLRRSTCDLAVLCVQSYGEELDWSILSSCFINKGLSTNQVGSSRQFMQALLVFTNLRDSIWTTWYSSQTPAAKKLANFLSKGSQHGSEDVWKTLDALLRRIPISLWGFESETLDNGNPGYTSMLEALKIGVTNSDEPRQNLSSGWACYVGICFWSISQLSNKRAQETTFRQFLVPIVIQHVIKDRQEQSWSLPASVNVKMAVNIVLRTMQEPYGFLFDDIWSMLSERLSTSLGLSLPKSSTDYAKSQESLMSQSSRYQTLKSQIMVQADQSGNEDCLNTIANCDKPLLNSALTTLESRSGKPYGIACVLRDLALNSNANASVVSAFIQKHSSMLFESPSAEYLVPILLRSNQLLETVLPTLIGSSNPNEYREQALITLLSTIDKDDLDNSQNLRDYIVNTNVHDSEGTLGKQTTMAILKNPELIDSDVQGGILSRLLNDLSEESTPNTQISALRIFTEIIDNPESSKDIIAMDDREILLSKVLFLADSAQPIMSETATDLLSKLKQTNVSQGDSSQTTSKIIESQLSGTGKPIAIFTLIDLALDTLQKFSEKSSANILLPSQQQWEIALHPHMYNSRPFALSISSPLQGLLYTIQGTDTEDKRLLRDVDQFSLAFRMAIYVTRMLSTNVLQNMDQNRIQALYDYYPVILQLVNEKITLGSANTIWLESSEEVFEEATTLLSQGRSIIQSWLEENHTVNGNISFTACWLNKLSDMGRGDFGTYFSALAFTDIVGHIIDNGGSSAVLDRFQLHLKNASRSHNIIESASLLVSIGGYFVNSSQGRRLVNELIADATDPKSANNLFDKLRPLLLLNVILNQDEEHLDGVPSQRLVFLMQSLLRLLSSSLLEVSISSEVMKLLCAVLPAICDIYGDHWENILETVVQCLDRITYDNNELPILHSSLRLYSRLSKLGSSNDANDDLVDALKTMRPKLDGSLLQCLQQFGRIDEDHNQPRQITTDLLSRLLTTVNLEHDIDIYHLLTSHDQAVQNATYGLLHRAVPGRQQQLSLDIVLEKVTPQFPVALLNIVQDFPGSLQAPEDDATLQLRPYLLSWHVIFDHFVQASHKLQEAYTSQIKITETIPVLLNVICDIIKITSGRPLDGSKFDIQDFQVGRSDTNEIELQWLAMHLYYCCLLYLPSLAKAWFIEQKNRIKYPLESWTQRYVSPSIIARAISVVSEWAATQDEDDTPVAIKSSPKGSEVVASIAIDPESPPVAVSISLPGSYPLESPSVSSRTRVGVSEKNWQSWLRTFQIIIFSSGSIIEGLMAFRRNIQGALKGQSECAICYSIIGTDMQRPDKKCGTCKNTFHGSCLFRWFKSSNSSSCPLCRNNFNYA